MNIVKEISGGLGPFEGYYYIIYEDRDTIHFIGDFETEGEAYDFWIVWHGHLRDEFKQEGKRLSLYIRGFSEYYLNQQTFWREMRKRHKTVKVYDAH